MTVSPFALLALAIPVLLLGEQLISRIRWLGRLNIPAPIVGGLIVAIGILIAQRLTPGGITLHDKTTSGYWLWPILPRWSVVGTASATPVFQPLLILFFTCIGLNASAALARKGGLPLLIFLALATVFAVVQNIVGVIVAKAIGVDPLLGLMCGGVTLMGGFGTAASWANAFEQAGLPDATTIGIAAAAFGVIAAGLLAGPLAGRLIETRTLANRSSETSDASMIDPEPISRRGFCGDLRTLFVAPGTTAIHFAVLFLCLKLGAFLSAAVGGVHVGQQNLTFPPYMGSLVIAAVIRNLHDLAGARFLDTRHIDVIASFSLAWLLATVMIGLQLGQLVHLAAPMLLMLFVQVALMLALAYWVVFPLMGRDYDAALMSGGMVGFGIGATHNALASMRQVSGRYGPSPRAFLVVSIVGAFLIDFTNAFSIMGFLNGFKH